MSGHDELAAGRQRERCCQSIGELEVIAIVRHIQYGLHVPIRIHRNILEVRGPDMCVRLQLVDRHRFLVCGHPDQFVAFGVRGNRRQCVRGTFRLRARIIGQ